MKEERRERERERGREEDLVVVQGRSSGSLVRSKRNNEPLLSPEISSDSVSSMLVTS